MVTGHPARNRGGRCRKWPGIVHLTMSQIAFLRSVAAFRSLSSDDLRGLSECMESLEFGSGEYIVRKGDPGNAMFVIKTGKASASVLDAKGRDFEAFLSEGDIFGEMALLTGEPRNADVVARSDVHCFRLSRERLDELLCRDSRVGRFLTSIVGERLQEDHGIRSVGKYLVLSELGKGGMSRVFEGRHRTLGLTVAVKMLSHELAYDEEFVRRFREESRILAGLRHDNIVQVIDVEEAYATLFIVMERINGTDLGSMIRSRGIIPFDETRSIVGQLAMTLDYAHSRGIIHRDVKPGNVMLEPTGRVKLMDFGIAKTRREATVPAEDLFGTPEYMSPEHARGAPMDGRSDLYSLGIMTYEMLVGEPPFRSENALDVLLRQEEEEVPSPREKNPDVPDDLAELVRVATQKAPQDRYSQGSEMARSLSPEDASALDLFRARSRTLTLIYDGRKEDLVDGMLARFREEASLVPGIHVSMPESSKVE